MATEASMEMWLRGEKKWKNIVCGVGWGSGPAGKGQGNR